MRNVLKKCVRLVVLTSVLLVPLSLRLRLRMVVVHGAGIALLPLVCAPPFPMVTPSETRTCVNIVTAPLHGLLIGGDGFHGMWPPLWALLPAICPPLRALLPTLCPPLWALLPGMAPPLVVAPWAVLATSGRGWLCGWQQARGNFHIDVCNMGAGRTTTVCNGGCVLVHTAAGHGWVLRGSCFPYQSCYLLPPVCAELALLPSPLVYHKHPLLHLPVPFPSPLP